MFEAFRVAVRISLANHASAGLVALSRGFLKAEGDAAKLQKRLDGIKGMFVGGAAMFGAGAAGLYGLEKLVKPAMGYAHQLAQLNVAGMNHLQIVQATQAAWAAMKTTPTSTATENLAAIRELRMVFGNTKDAIRYMPVMQQVQAILQNVSDGKGGNLGGQAYTVGKALENRGATKSPREFLLETDLMTKAINASGGRVTPQDFLSAVKYGRRAAYGWNNDFMYRILPTLIQEMKGGGGGGRGGPGNAIMSAYTAIVGGTIPQKSLSVYDKLGLVDPSKVVWTKTHSMKGVKPGGIVGADLFQANPYQWAQTILLPAMLKHGITDPKRMREYLQYMFPNRTASIMDQMVMQAWKFQRDMRLIDKSNGLGAYQQLLKTDPEMAALALQKQWQNLMIRLGYSILPKVLDGIQWLIPKIESLTKWTMQHGTAVKNILLGFAGLSAALMVGGTLMMTVSAFRFLGLALRFAVIGGPAGILRLGNALVGVAGGLGVLTKAAGAFIAVYAAWEAGWAAGKWLNKHVINPAIKNATHGKSLTLGDYIYAQSHKHGYDPNSGSKELARQFGGGHLDASGKWVRNLPPELAGLLAAARAEKQRDPDAFVKGGWGNKHPIQVNTTINVDGKKLATVVSQHQAKAASSAQAGTSRFDLTSSPPPLGLNLAPVH